MIITLATGFFWLLAFLIAYSFAGYPLCLYLLTRFSNPLNTPPKEYAPKVSIIIAAFNEEAVIAQRIKNIQSINYPQDKIEILIGSDNSSDATVAQARSVFAQNVKVFDFKQRQGKLGTVNSLVKEAAGEILIFTDANTAFDKDAIKNIVKPYCNDSIGAIGGKKTITAEKITGRGEGIYKRIESFILDFEGKRGTCVSLDGSIYSVRRSLYTYPPTDKLFMDDLFITLSVMQKGYRCGYQADAIAYEDSSMDFKSELKRKGRICAGSLNVIKELSTLLIPFKSPIAFELWSHKVLRYCGGIILLLLLIVNIIIAQQPFYRDILVLQGIFYLLGTIGYYFSKKNITIPLFYYPFYFLFMNYSHLYAIKILLKQRRKFAWERVGR